MSEVASYLWCSKAHMYHAISGEFRRTAFAGDPDWLPKARPAYLS
jgi:hypothetical protein